MVVMALHRASETAYDESVARACEWVLGMQSRNGGWGAFDADNSSYWLYKLPFCDFGYVIDPPSEDVSAHALEVLLRRHGDGGISMLARRIDADLRRDAARRILLQDILARLRGV